MATWLSLLISLGCSPSFSSSNSFSSPSLLSLPVPFNPSSSSSPVVVIPIIEEPQLNQIPSETPLQPPSPCPSPGYHRDPLSCAHFYICTDLWAVGAQFQVHRLACAPGTVWDEVHLTCNWPNQVPSCANQVEEEGSDDVMEEKESTVKEEEQEEEVKEEGKEGKGELFWSGVWSSHKCNGPGISAHPDQCSKFWLCRQLGEGKELQALLFQCPPNYQFNSTILRCSEAGSTCQVGTAQWRAEEIGVFVLDEKEMEKFFDAWSPPSSGQMPEEGSKNPTQSVTVLYDLR